MGLNAGEGGRANGGGPKHQASLVRGMPWGERVS